MKILIVDDDVHARAVCRTILEEEGFEVIEAVDGAAGLRAYCDVGADLVLCDLFMPDVDGIELIRALRRDSPDLPIVAMSAGGFHGSVDLLDVARQLGASAILPKPYGLHVFLRVVRHALATAERS